MAVHIPLPAKAKSSSKSVQELLINGEEPPGAYFYKDGACGILDPCLPLVEIPIIDIGLLTSPSNGREEIDKLHSALSSYGCFMVCFCHQTLIESLSLGSTCSYVWF